MVANVKTAQGDTYRHSRVKGQIMRGYRVTGSEPPGATTQLTERKEQ